MNLTVIQLAIPVEPSRVIIQKQPDGTITIVIEPNVETSEDWQDVSYW